MLIPSQYGQYSDNIAAIQMYCIKNSRMTVYKDLTVCNERPYRHRGQSWRPLGKEVFPEDVHLLGRTARPGCQL